LVGWIHGRIYNWLDGLMDEEKIGWMDLWMGWIIVWMN
jgi:hypothetical protein